MAEKHIVLLLTMQQEYTRHVGIEEKKYASQMNLVYDSISNVYLPLLNMFSRLESENIHFRLSLVLSPVVCSLLSDSSIQEQYIQHLEKKIELGKKELSRNEGSASLTNCISSQIEKIKKDKDDFVNLYKKNLVEAFSSWQKKGFIELLTTCATDIFIPYYSNLEETVNAQIETGLHSHRMYFGDNPLGFYIPEMAYIRGIESSLRSYGFSYSVLDSRALLFTEQELKKGIFSPVVSDDNIIFFASDNRAVQNLEDFSKNDLYCDCARDIAFELPQEKLSPYIEKGFSRCPSSFCYWNNGGKSFSGQLKSKYTYNQKDAFKQCEKDAEVFLSEKLELLNKAESLFKEKEQSCLVFSICANELARTWKEFPVFIENLFRKDNQNLFTDFSSIIGKKDVLQKVKPYYSSAGLSGYGEAFLSNKNNWMIKYVRKASARMQDLALRFPDGTGLKERLLNLGAKELLLAHSSILGKMVYNDEFPEYAVDSFKERLLAFTTVFESLGSNTVSTEWLCDLENRHPIFSWLNYRIFTKKQ